MKQLLAQHSQPDAQAAAKPTLNLPPLRHTAPVLLFFALLPYLLPESDVLARTALIQWLAGYIPSAAKLASVSAYPNVVFVHVVLMLAAVPILAIACAPAFTYRVLCQVSIPNSMSRRLLVMPVIVGGVLLLCGVIALVYFLPGGATGVPFVSRAGLGLAAITCCKLGLALVGSAVGYGVFVVEYTFAIGVLRIFILLLKPTSTRGNICK
ncbi:MAG: hypothetical protein L6Q68_00865 [Aquabacterium sp.]|nr:hypothetical protein [Aquabacterium sp.]